MVLVGKQPKTHKPSSTKNTEKTATVFFQFIWVYNTYYIYLMIERFHTFYRILEA